MVNRLPCTPHLFMCATGLAVQLVLGDAAVFFSSGWKWRRWFTLFDIYTDDATSSNRVVRWGSPPVENYHVELWYERWRWWWWRRYVVTTKLPPSNCCRHIKCYSKLSGILPLQQHPGGNSKPKPYTQQSNRDLERFVPPGEEEDGVLLLPSMPINLYKLGGWKDNI